MTLTDLANHICTQCGMTDTDDVAAAQMFLQRRLEMIWNAALWRDSLLEATLTISPGGSGGSTNCISGQGTTSLADSYWIPQRSVLLLPSAIEKVIAARLSTNTLEVASLESYYRTDTDWLDYQGTPFEFQILKPVVMEWAAAQMLSALDTNAADGTANPPVSCNYSYSPDGVTICAGSGAFLQGGTLIGNGSGSTTGGGQVLQLFSFSKPPTQGNVTLTAYTPVNVAGVSYVGGAAPVPSTAGAVYTITPGTNENGVRLVNGTQSVTLATGTPLTVTAQGSSLLFQQAGLIPAGAGFSDGSFTVNGLQLKSTYDLVWGANETYATWGGNTLNSPGAGQVSVIQGASSLTLNGPIPPPNHAVTAQVYPALALTATVIDVASTIVVMASSSLPPMHQRIRLTEAPTVSINLRVLGKGKCPILGPYDSAPITNAEPALMAFARGDLLLRQRQFGKAALAQQEGAALLKELVENEAFQQAGEFRIQPDGGFGSDIWWCTQPDSYHPLG